MKGIFSNGYILRCLRLSAGKSEWEVRIDSVLPTFAVLTAGTEPALYAATVTDGFVHLSMPKALQYDRKPINECPELGTARRKLSAHHWA